MVPEGRKGDDTTNNNKMYILMTIWHVGTNVYVCVIGFGISENYGMWHAQDNSKEMENSNVGINI